MKSANPALNAKVFNSVSSAVGSATMTLQGTVNKTLVSFLFLLMGASYTWGQYFQAESPSGVNGLVIGGAIIGFILSIVTIFKKEWSPFTTPLYATCQGLFLGGISAMFEFQYPGIVMQAVGLTFATFTGMLFLYKSKIIAPTENFKLGLSAAMMGLMVFYGITFIASFFGVSFPLFHGNGIMAIGFSLFVCGLAALNLVMDFDFIEQGAESGAPAYMEWYGAFGLMVTLVWLYMEILRLLMKLRSRD
ncbi:Bax inhibitor-1/YccA family protein [bacterium]|nr:Bax inhibitor-1/YccA family protein [bacterium]